MFATDQGIDLDYQVVDLFTGEHLKPEFAKINPNLHGSRARGWRLPAD